MKALELELQELQEALKNNKISVNYYCSMYYSISQQIKQLNK
jgi:hypothetical protein